MKLSASKKFSFLIIGILCVPLLFMCISDVHPWGDDFAQYMSEAVNISNGKPYYLTHNIFNPYNTSYAPPFYPPGFPLLIAPIIHFTGIAIKPLLYFMNIICVAFALMMYKLLRKHFNSVISICIVLLFIYSEEFIYLKRCVLSDIPSLLAVTTYLTIRAKNSLTRMDLIWLTILGVLAILIRSQNIILVFAEVAVFFVGLVSTIFKNGAIIQYIRGSKPTILMISLPVFWYLTNTFLFHSPTGGSAFYIHYLSMIPTGKSIEYVHQNFSNLRASISFYFLYTQPFFLSVWLIGWLKKIFIVFTFAGWIISMFRNFSVKEAFFLFMCLLIIFLPVFDARYFLPALPLAFLYVATTFKWLVKSIGKITYRLHHITYVYTGLLLTIVLLLSGINVFSGAFKEPCPGCVPTNREKIAFEYIKTHVKDNEIIVFDKPRLLALYTGKMTVVQAWQEPQEKNKQYFDSLGVKYILVLKWLNDDYFHKYLNNIQHPIDSQQLAGEYMLYKLR